jgi:heme-degrading monooxygenase HmoA
MPYLSERNSDVYRHEPLPRRQRVRSSFRACLAFTRHFLEKVPGFVEFHLLKGPEAEAHTLYASHTVWEDCAVFEAWTKSEAFRAAHRRAGGIWIIRSLSTKANFSYDTAASDGGSGSICASAGWSPSQLPGLGFTSVFLRSAEPTRPTTKRTAPDAINQCGSSIVPPQRGALG